jgi:hypothetical protein
MLTISHGAACLDNRCPHGAIRDLRERGLVRTLPSKGTFVTRHR